MRKSNLPERERILGRVIQLLSYDSAGTREPSATFLEKSWGNPSEPGDLVVLGTCMNPHWIAAWMLRRIDSHIAILRELGGPSIIEWSNDSYQTLHYDRVCFAKDFLEQHEYELHWKLTRAICRFARFRHRLLSLNFEGLPTWRSRRPAVATFFDHHHREAPTYSVPIIWNSKTAIHDIVEQLRNGGYGDDSKFTGVQNAL